MLRSVDVPPLIAGKNKEYRMPLHFARVSVRSLVPVVACVLGACSGQSVPNAATPTPEHTKAPAAAASATQAPGESADQEAPAAAQQPTPSFTLLDVNFVPAKVSDSPKKTPRPWIETPGFDQFVAREWIPGYKVIVKVPNWEQAPPGSYLQFLFDGRPLEPITDFKNGLKLLDLVGGEDALGDGEHILAAYVARPNHESIKGPSGVSVHRFWVGKRAPDTYNSREPMLILGSPFGVYKGDAAFDILIDWYVLNTVLEKKDASLHLVLKGPGLPEEGAERYITEWRPWTIVSAKHGEYTLQADLLDKNGHPAKGTWTSVTRKFVVD
jgi:hypothetical protein